MHPYLLLRCLNTPSTAIFAEILKRKTGDITFINAPGRASLVLRCMSHRKPARGIYYQLYQRWGATTDDPVMEFYLLDLRHGGDNIADIFIFPIGRKKDQEYAMEYSTRMAAKKRYPGGHKPIGNLQDLQCDFAESWLSDIKSQGYF